MADKKMTIIALRAEDLWGIILTYWKYTINWISGVIILAFSLFALM